MSKKLIPELIDLLSKYPIVTRQLLLIRPTLPGDDSWDFTHDAAGELKKAAAAGDWEVFDLAGQNATKAKILKEIKDKQPDFIIYYGHSCFWLHKDLLRKSLRENP